VGRLRTTVEDGGGGGGGRERELVRKGVHWDVVGIRIRYRASC
jgi:hypothetical protein